VILVVQDSAPAEAVADSLVQHMNGDLGMPRAVISGAGRGAAWASRAFADAQDALSLTVKLAPSERIVRCDTLGFLLALYRAGPDALRASPFADSLRELRTEDGADLFHTLEVYLDLGGSGVSAADALHIHRSTLNYRLGRITDLTHADLGDPLQRVNLHTALKLIRLFE
jgi:DNA-binding PucR family transcriptional regulator